MGYLIMCIGNREGGDDAIGPYIADKLNDNKSSNFMVLDCGIIPENYTSIVKKNKPDNLIIIDAIEMGLNPGEIRIVPENKIGIMHISTHGIPLSILVIYLKKYVKNIIIVGIQPKTMHGKISEIVLNSANKLINSINNKNLKRLKILE